MVGGVPSMSFVVIVVWVVELGVGRRRGTHLTFRLLGTATATVAVTAAAAATTSIGIPVVGWPRS